jgi:uncharacterized repeat protein (TIGR01451 family)
MRKLSFISLITLLGLTLWLAWGSLSPSLAQEPPPDRPSAPPDTPGGPTGRSDPPPPGGGSRGGGGSSGGGDIFGCSNVHGVVTSWGHRNEPKLPITLNGPGWQTQKVTDDNGYYASDCLGLGLALLNPVSPAWLRPMTKDVAIRLGFRPVMEVNLGVWSGLTPEPEVTPTMVANVSKLQPGERVSYTIRVTNALSAVSGARPAMGEVMVTDLLPESLTPITATTTQGLVEWWGQLLTVDVGTLAPGKGVTIVVTAQAQAGAPAASIIDNRASLLHHDHVAVQTPLVSIEVGPGSN